MIASNTLFNVDGVIVAIKKIEPGNKRRDKGEGSIYQRADGLWVSKYKNPNKSKPDYKYFVLLFIIMFYHLLLYYKV